MAWLESHQSLRDHPKKDRLAELLFNGTVPNDVSDYAAAGLLHYLWYWALDYAHDGDLAKFSDSQVAKGCRWNGDSLLLVKALIEAGFVNKDRSLHDWDEYAGRLLATREKDRERKKGWRDRVPSASRSASPDAEPPRPFRAGARGRADVQTNKQTDKILKSRISNPSKVKGLSASIPMPAGFCPNDGATIQADGHCPVCDYREVATP